jgi:hypothetical protein
MKYSLRSYVRLSKVRMSVGIEGTDSTRRGVERAEEDAYGEYSAGAVLNGGDPKCVVDRGSVEIQYLGYAGDG